MRSSLLPGLCFLGMLVMATVPGSAQKIVLSIDGNWWDSNGQGLGFASRVNGPCVFGDGGLLQVADAGTKAAETFTYDKMTSACPSSCTARPSGVPASAHCHDATVPAAATGVVRASLVPDINLRPIIDLLFRRPQMYIVAAARGLEDEPLEAVLSLDGSEVDVSAALQPLPTATYLWTLDPVDGGMGGGTSGKVSWQPSQPSKVRMPGVAPGLYRLTVAVEGGESEGSQAWALLSSPAQYPADTKEFRQAVEITQSWGERVDTSGKRALLRATLRSLADRDAGK